MTLEEFLQRTSQWGGFNQPTTTPAPTTTPSQLGNWWSQNVSTPQNAPQPAPSPAPQSEVGPTPQARKFPAVQQALQKPQVNANDINLKSNDDQEDNDINHQGENFNYRGNTKDTGTLGNY